MYLLQKIYLGFVSAFWLAGILFIKDSFQWWWLFLLIQLVLLLLSVFVINKYKFKGNFIQFVILPIAFCLASFLFLVFISLINIDLSTKKKLFSIKSLKSLLPMGSFFIPDSFNLKIAFAVLNFF